MYFSVMHNAGGSGMADPINLDAFLTQVNISHVVCFIFNDICFV